MKLIHLVGAYQIETLHSHVTASHEWFADNSVKLNADKRYYYLKICDLDVCLYLKFECKCFAHEIPYLGVLSSFAVRLFSCVS